MRACVRARSQNDYHDLVIVLVEIIQMPYLCACVCKCVCVRVRVRVRA